jgi:hypothetical protein
MLTAPEEALPCVSEIGVPPAINAGAPSTLGGRSVTPGGNTPRTPGVAEATPVASVGNGVKVGRGVLVGVGTAPADRPTSVSPTEQARLASDSKRIAANRPRKDRARTPFGHAGRFMDCF